VRDGVLYLVCTLWDYDDLKQLVLHRMTSAELLDTPVKKAEGFDLDRYIRSGQFSAPQGEGTLRLVARFDPGCALHLRETHLSADQTLVDEPGGWVRIEASVPDTAELRWWLLGFGDGVEIIGPAGLRVELAATARAMAEVYRD
jgi:predicted DNA-binding transcriptional regulator YafY